MNVSAVALTLLAYTVFALQLPAQSLPFDKEEPPKFFSVIGADGVRIIRGAEKVETFLLDPYKRDPVVGEKIEDYAIRSTGPVRDNTFAKRIAFAVFNEQNLFDLTKRCMFRP